MLALRQHALFDFQKICLQYEQSAGQKKTLLFDSHLNYVFTRCVAAKSDRLRGVH